MSRKIDKQTMSDWLHDAVSLYQNAGDETTDTDNLGSYLRDYFKKYGVQCNYDCGCSKGVIVFSSMPFVIKFDSWDDNEDERGSECQRELLIYREAVKRGLECFFPETEFLCYVSDVNFYLQQKIDCQDANIRDWEYRKAIQKINRSVSGKIVSKFQSYLEKEAPFYVRHISERWISAVISLYGKKKALELENFIVEMGINDMHGNNIGWYKKKPVILDFSGFYRET